MQPFVIKQAEFVTSVGAGSAYPPPERAEIAIVGKSNVGKSSLINHLCGNKKLAKTSQTPGKTRLINFFLLNRDFYLVDLPGYGFARASKTEQAGWGSLMEQYLSSGRVQHLFLLIDIRHAPTAEDRQMFFNRTSSMLMKMFEYMLRTHTEEAACVTHGGVIMNMLSQHALPFRKPEEWMTDPGAGYSVRLDAEMWMRDHLAEAYDVVPHGYLDGME